MYLIKANGIPRGLGSSQRLWYTGYCWTPYQSKARLYRCLAAHRTAYLISLNDQICIDAPREYDCDFHIEVARA